MSSVEEYMTQSRRKLYLAGESFDFVWDEPEVTKVKRLWRGGDTVKDIAMKMGRDSYEVLILLIDLHSKTRVIGLQVDQLRLDKNAPTSTYKRKTTKPRMSDVTCNADGCDRQAKAKGLCSKHYLRERKQRLREDAQ